MKKPGKMNQLMVLVGVLAVVSGCTSPRQTSASLSSLSTRTKKTFHEAEWSSDRADMAVYPTTQGPVDSYRPIYKVDAKRKVTGTGTGRTEEEAIKNAIYNCCTSNNCDYVAAARRVVRTRERDGNVCFDVSVTGFPAVLESLQTVKVAFYEQQKDGSIRPIDAPEHRYILETNGVWRVERFNDKEPQDLVSENVKPQLKSIEREVMATSATLSTETPPSSLGRKPTPGQTSSFERTISRERRSALEQTSSLQRIDLRQSEKRR